MKVGDVIWRLPVGLESNRRGRKVYREAWERIPITGETTRSWLVGESWAQVKLPKRGHWPTLYARSEAEIDDLCWAGYGWPISDAMRHVRDPAILRQVAALIGWMEPKP